jgi:fibronectin type 3 domain-containing protein
MSAIVISWKDAGSAALGYEVWRSLVNDSSTAVKIADTTGNTYRDTTGTTFLTYYYWVKAKNSRGTSGFGPSSGPILLGLAAPTGVIATTGDVSTTTISWDAADYATGYNLYRNTTDDSAGADFIAAVGGLFHVDTPPNYDTPYFYWLKSYAPGGTSPFSLVAVGYVAPAAPATPTGVGATVDTAGTIGVTWADAARAQAYEIWRNTVNNSSTATHIGDSSVNNYDDTGVPYGDAYYYWIKAVNYTGTSGFSAAAYGYSPYPVPEAPTSPAASSVYYDRIEVTADPSTYATSYELWSSIFDNSASATRIASGLGSPSYTDYAASIGVTYYWWKATNASGTSEFSSSATGEIIGPPAAPAYVDATDGSEYDKVTVSWPAVSGATSYAIYRSATLGGTKTLLTSGLGATSYDDTSLADTNVYYYWVTASNGAGASGYAPVGGAETGYAAAPAAPTGVNATDGTAPGKVTVAWSAAAGALSYSVEQADTLYGTRTTLASGLTATTYDDTTPTDATARYYFVIAHNGVGATEGTPDTGYSGAPATPGSVSATTDRVEHVELTWDAAEGATSYAIWRATSNSFGAATQLVSGFGDLVFYDTTAPFDTGLYYFVVAESAIGDSSPSASAYGYSPFTLPSTPYVYYASTSYTGFLLRWTAATAAAEYEVALSDSVGMTPSYASHPGLSAAILEHFWDPAGLAAEGYYPQYYFVRGMNRAGAGPWSAPVGPIYTA